jgi:hypothetical protein
MVGGDDTLEQLVTEGGDRVVSTLVHWDELRGLDLIAKAGLTPPGMAGIVGTCREGTMSCRTCHYWGGNSAEPVDGVHVATTMYQRWVKGEPKKQPCWLYRRIRRGQLTPEERSRAIPYSTPACSYYRRAESPQPVTKPRTEAMP